MSDNLEERTEYSPRKNVILTKMDYSIGPIIKAEQIVLEYIKKVMGNENKALSEFYMLSREFTISENTQHYKPEDFLSARAQYIHYKFKQELEIWPSH